ncbi:hypothetical protein QN416_27005, partial [Glaciimonas sp. Cout2]|uniref:hypothetical protein n=1 Tax=Glaciimonas sp. Cout2 TaxID=3048621 RepID=UPI002B23B01E
VVSVVEISLFRFEGDSLLFYMDNVVLFSDEMVFFAFFVYGVWKCFGIFLGGLISLLTISRSLL